MSLECKTLQNNVVNVSLYSPCSPPLPEHVFTLPPCPSGHRLGIDLLRFRAGMVDDESWWNVSARWCKKRIRAISRRVTQNNQDRCFWAIYRILTCCVSSVIGNISFVYLLRPRCWKWVSAFHSAPSHPVFVICFLLASFLFTDFLSLFICSLFISPPSSSSHWILFYIISSSPSPCFISSFFLQHFSDILFILMCLRTKTLSVLFPLHSSLFLAVSSLSSLLS